MDELNSIDREEVKAKDISKYQTVTFDLSFVVNNTVKYEVFEQALKNANVSNLNSYELVDVFEDEEKLKDKKSVTLRFTIGSDDHTLDSNEIEKSRQDVVAFEAKSIFMRV